MNSLFFEDFKEGQVFTSPGPRTIDDDAVRRFADLSGDKNALHLDDAFAARSPFKERIAHGLLGLSAASGLLHDLGIIRESVVAFTGLDWKFKAPIRVGDRLTLRMRVLQTRSAGKHGGIVFFESTVLNQKNEILQTGTWSLMVKRRV